MKFPNNEYTMFQGVKCKIVIIDDDPKWDCIIFEVPSDFKGYLKNVYNNRYIPFLKKNVRYNFLEKVTKDKQRTIE